MADGSNLAVVGYLRPRIHEGGPCGCADMDQYRYALEHGPRETGRSRPENQSDEHKPLGDADSIFRNF